MPKFMVVARSFLNFEAGPRLVEVGEIVEFDGSPGASLAPMDAEAMALKIARDEILSEYALKKSDLRAQRWRDALPKGLATVLARAEATFILPNSAIVISAEPA